MKRLAWVLVGLGLAACGGSKTEVTQAETADMAAAMNTFLADVETLCLPKGRDPKDLAPLFRAGYVFPPDNPSRPKDHFSDQIRGAVDELVQSGVVTQQRARVADTIDTSAILRTTGGYRIWLADFDDLCFGVLDARQARAPSIALAKQAIAGQFGIQIKDPHAERTQAGQKAGYKTGDVFAFGTHQGQPRFAVSAQIGTTTLLINKPRVGVQHLELIGEGNPGDGFRSLGSIGIVIAK